MKKFCTVSNLYFCYFYLFKIKLLKKNEILISLKDKIKSLNEYNIFYLINYFSCCASAF